MFRTISWILQIDGHTDDVNGVYADNWDLSTERALSVVRFGDRRRACLAAICFRYGEFQPIATGNSIEDRQKNRRIEPKLTQRVNLNNLLISSLTLKINPRQPSLGVGAHKGH